MNTAEQHENGKMYIHPYNGHGRQQSKYFEGPIYGKLL